MPLSLSQFTEQLERTGLLSSAELQSLLDKIPEGQRPADLERLARLLVQRQVLSVYQAQQLYVGKGSSLVLGNYLLVEKLGQGGMGIVFKALHRRMNRVVALKIMSPEGMKSADAVQRFHREVQAAARLTHPHIVTAFDADEAHGKHFLVMEYIAGQDLASLVWKRGILPVDQALRYLEQTARGLDYAHRHGVIHRDIKPSNLLLDERGQIKILDMGLARLTTERPDQFESTATGAVIGTIDFMSPEQALNTKSADARSDIYSLGVTLWYLLTGRPMYTGETMVSRVLAHREHPVPSLMAARGDVSAAVDAVFRQMVAKRPEDRPATMGEVIIALESLRTATPAGSGPADRIMDSAFERFLVGMDNSKPNPREATQVEATKTLPSKDPVLGPSAGKFSDDPFLTQPEAVRTADDTDVAEREFVTRATHSDRIANDRPTSRRRRLSTEPRVVGIAVVFALLIGVGVVNNGARDRVARDNRSSEKQRVASTVSESTPKSVLTGSAWKPTASQQAFFDDVARLPAAEQAAAVAIQLQGSNPRFDGQFAHEMTDGKVTEFEVSTLEITDIWPIRALRDLTSLRISEPSLQGRLRDLSPLVGLKLTSLDCSGNPGILHLAHLSSMPLKELSCDDTLVADLTPLSAMKLNRLDCGRTQVSNLGALKGMSLTTLTCDVTGVSDLSPLTGMPLIRLYLHNTEVSDLLPLSGMRLSELNIANCPVADLTPLAGMPLNLLACSSTSVSDLSPLIGMPIDTLYGDNTLISDFRPLIGMPLRSSLGVSVPLFYPPDETLVRSLSNPMFGPNMNAMVPVDEFWQKFEARRAAAEAFARACADLPADELVQAVVAKFRSGSGGTEISFGPTIRDNTIVEATVSLPLSADDVTPLRALRTLRKLTINQGPGWLDLSPINSLPLEALTCTADQALRNAPMLAAIPSLTTINGQPKAQYLAGLRSASRSP